MYRLFRRRRNRLRRRRHNYSICIRRTWLRCNNRERSRTAVLAATMAPCTTGQFDPTISQTGEQRWFSVFCCVENVLVVAMRANGLNRNFRIIWISCKRIWTRCEIFSRLDRLTSTKIHCQACSLWRMKLARWYGSSC